MPSSVTIDGITVTLAKPLAAIATYEIASALVREGITDTIKIGSDHGFHVIQVTPTSSVSANIAMSFETREQLGESFMGANLRELVKKHWGSEHVFNARLESLEWHDFLPPSE